jgi:putative flippase GtrA
MRSGCGPRVGACSGAASSVGDRKGTRSIFERAVEEMGGLNETGTHARSTYEVIRYLMVGGLNTLFGYGCFTAFNIALGGLGPHAYLLASLLSNLVAISAAFLAYKWFVFRTRGNYLREWLRCLAVYSTGIVVTLAGMPVVVTLLRRTSLGGIRFGGTPLRAHAPYIAAAVMALLVVGLSYLGHKHVSFRRTNVQRPDHPGTDVSSAEA